MAWEKSCTPTMQDCDSNGCLLHALRTANVDSRVPQVHVRYSQDTRGHVTLLRAHADALSAAVKGNHLKEDN
mgnify:CR=1 FL=1